MSGPRVPGGVVHKLPVLAIALVATGVAGVGFIFAAVMCTVMMAMMMRMMSSGGNQK